MTDQLCYLCLGGPATVAAPGYGFSVCQNCWQHSSQGWDPAFEPAIFRALVKASLLIPDRCANGRLPQSYSPPADFNL